MGLITVSGAVNHAGVQEIGFGATLGDAAGVAGGLRGEAQAVLLGGYFGGWADVEEPWGLPLEPRAMRSRRLALRFGVGPFLPAGTPGGQATPPSLAPLPSPRPRA